MAKIQRILHKIFGASGSSDNFAKFGSLVAAAPVKTKDILTIQSLPAWDDGWQEAVYGGNKDILIQDLNAWCFEHSRQVGYLFQAGIAEYDATTTYYQGSLVQATDGSGNVYVSLQDNNIGNTPPSMTDNAFWAWWNPSGSGSGLDADTVDGLHASATPEAGKLLALDGTAKFPVSVFSGAIVQVVRNEGGTYQAISSAIPQDDTIPQSSEGVEILTVSITPKAASSRLRVTGNIPFTKAGVSVVVAALFKDSETDARATSVVWQDAVGSFFNLPFDFEMVAGSTAPTTFKVRIGSTGGAELHLAGYDAGRLYGGTWKYSLCVEEIAA